MTDDADGRSSRAAIVPPELCASCLTRPTIFGKLHLVDQSHIARRIQARVKRYRPELIGADLQWSCAGPEKPDAG